MTYEDSPLGALPVELKMMIMMNVCQQLPLNSLIEFAATKETLGSTKEEFLAFVKYQPLYVEKTNDAFKIGFQIESDDDEDYVPDNDEDYVPVNDEYYVPDPMEEIND
jgi:hypothetical protein